MKQKPEIAVLLLWLIAIATTFLFVKETGTFTYLGPVYALCMIGSVLAVKRSRAVKKM